MGFCSRGRIRSAVLSGALMVPPRDNSIFAEHGVGRDVRVRFHSRADARLAKYHAAGGHDEQRSARAIGARAQRLVRRLPQEPLHRHCVDVFMDGAWVERCRRQAWQHRATELVEGDAATNRRATPYPSGMVSPRVNTTRAAALGDHQPESCAGWLCRYPLRVIYGPRGAPLPPCP